MGSLNSKYKEGKVVRHAQSTDLNLEIKKPKSITLLNKKVTVQLAIVIFQNNR